MNVCRACEIPLPQVAGPLCSYSTLPGSVFACGGRSGACWEAFCTWASKRGLAQVDSGGRFGPAGQWVLIANCDRSSLEVLIDEWLSGRDLAELRARWSEVQRAHARMALHDWSLSREG